MKAVEHYIAWNDNVREIAQFMTHPDVAAAMEGRSEEVSRQIKDWLKAVAHGKVRRTENPIDKASDFLRRNYVFSVLRISPAGFLRQSWNPFFEIQFETLARFMGLLVSPASCSPV